MTKITISEGMNWLKTLKERHTELVQLRNENSKQGVRFFGANAEKEQKLEPVYNVKKLDQLITQVAREIRLVDNAIKSANTKFKLNYDQDDSILGVVE